MKKVFFILPILLFCISSDAKVSIKSITDKISSTAGQAREELEAIGKKANDSIDTLKNAFKDKRNPIFCPARPLHIYAPTVEDPEVVKQDSENMIPVIKKYAPILYLCNELYYPIAAEDIFTVPDTQLVYQPNHIGNPSSPKTIVIPRGQVTMEKIYENRTKYSGIDFFFEIGECARFGSNPAQFSDGRGNVTTPIYVTWNQHNNKIYIVYAFLYGFNGAYPVTMPVKGSHLFDLEHITLELNANKQLERIFFAAHSSAEGVWLAANHPDITYEGTHPIVYVAQTGHGSYPREGTHVRIYGFGNDITCKTKKWIPQLVLLYPLDDARFNPKTMGWASHSGEYGRSGVGSFQRFFGGQHDLSKGQLHDNVQFCPNPSNPNNPIDMIKHQACIESKRMKAEIP